MAAFGVRWLDLNISELRRYVCCSVQSILSLIHWLPSVNDAQLRRQAAVNCQSSVVCCELYSVCSYVWSSSASLLCNVVLLSLSHCGSVVDCTQVGNPAETQEVIGAVSAAPLSRLAPYSLRQWLQLRFEFDSTAIRPHCDHSTTYVTTVRPAVMGCCTMRPK